MPEAQAIKTINVENTQFSMTPYSFNQVAEVFVPVPLTIEKVVSPIFLTNVWFTPIFNSALISVDAILSAEHVMQLVALSSYQKRDLSRFVVIQLNMSDVDWGLINLEHFCLVKASDSIAHCNVPIEKTVEKRHTPLEMVTVEKLCRQINWEGYSLYSIWLDAEIAFLSTHISKLATEEYQLQARLDDFHHEVCGALISGSRKICRQLVIERGNPSLTSKQQQEIERRIIEQRMEMRNSLQIQCEVSREIVENILKIGSKFPEFIPLRYTLSLFYSLIEPQLNYQGDPGQTWEQQLVLMSLLHMQLGVTCCLSGDKERTSKGQAISLVIGGMVEKYGLDSVVSMALQWDKQSDLYQVYSSSILNAS